MKFFANPSPMWRRTNSRKFRGPRSRSSRPFSPYTALTNPITFSAITSGGRPCVFTW